MPQVDLMGKNHHRIVYMRALKNGVKKGDLTSYQAGKLMEEYDAK